MSPVENCLAHNDERCAENFNIHGINLSQSRAVNKLSKEFVQMVERTGSRDSKKTELTMS